MRKPEKSIKKKRATVNRALKRSQRIKKTQAEKPERKERVRLEKRKKEFDRIKQELDFKQHLHNLMPNEY